MQINIISNSFILRKKMIFFFFLMNFMFSDFDPKTEKMKNLFVIVLIGMVLVNACVAQYYVHMKNSMPRIGRNYDMAVEENEEESHETDSSLENLLLSKIYKILVRSITLFVLFN